MTDLYQEHLKEGNSIQHQRVKEMADRDLRPEYEDLKVVDSDSKPQSYLVAKVSVLTKPFPRADVAADRTEVMVCSCDGFYYHESQGFENAEISVGDFGKCKHCTAFRAEKAKEDDNQESLF